MNHEEYPIRCANCEIPISWKPVTLHGEPFCCSGCAAGGPCICSYSQHGGERVLAEHLSAEPFILRGGHRLEKKEPQTAPQGAITPERHPSDSASPGGKPPAQIDDELKSSLAEFLAACYRAVGADQPKEKALATALEVATAAFKAAAEKIASSQAGVTTPEENQSPLGPQTRQETQPLTLIVSPLPDPSLAAQFGEALERQPGVSQTSLLQFQEGTATFQLRVASAGRLVTALMQMPRFRPQTLRVSNQHMELTLAGVPTEAAVALAPTPPARGGEAKETLAPQVMDRLETVAHGQTYEIGVDVFFNARHYVTLQDGPGPVHPHSWRLHASVSGRRNGQQIVVGFAEVRRALQEAVAKYDNTLLNRVPPFTEIQPTTENMAAVLFRNIEASLEPLPVKLKSVSLWETPTNQVTYFGDGDHEG